MNGNYIHAEVGKRLKLFRQDQGLTQAELAEMVGILRTSVTNIEAGVQHPPLVTLYKFAFALNRELSDILPAIADLPEEDVNTVVIGGRLQEIPVQSLKVLQRILKED